MERMVWGSETLFSERSWADLVGAREGASGNEATKPRKMTSAAAAGGIRMGLETGLRSIFRIEETGQTSRKMIT